MHGGTAAGRRGCSGGRRGRPRPLRPQHGHGESQSAVAGGCTAVGSTVAENQMQLVCASVERSS